MPRPDSSHLAVITGASAGLGRAFTDRLARRGHPLLLTGRDRERLEQVAAEVRTQHGVSVRVLVADLATESDIERVAGVLANEDVGVLVNNAGFGTRGRLVSVDIEEQARMIRLHVMAPMRLTHAVLPAMLARRAGWIINVSSVASFMYSAGNTNYCATKAYLTRFTQSLDTELVGTGVAVQALCPGFIRTEFHPRARMDMSMIPSWLWSTPEAIADASLRAIEREGPVVVIPTLRFRVIRRMIEVMPHALMRRGRDVLKRSEPA